MKYLLLLCIKIRWFYFHVNPNYIKFNMGQDEFWFQNRKTGTLHCNYYIKEDT